MNTPPVMTGDTSPAESLRDECKRQGATYVELQQIDAGEPAAALARLHKSAIRRAWWSAATSLLDVGLPLYMLSNIPIPAPRSGVWLAAVLGVMFCMVAARDVGLVRQHLRDARRLRELGQEPRESAALAS